MAHIQESAHYICDSCGEQIEVDVSAGSEQEYVEDFPVCCRPNLLLYIALYGLGAANK